MSPAASAPRDFEPGLHGAWLGQTQELGPANASTLVAAFGCRTLVKPMILGATMLGTMVNRIDPSILQSVSLAALDPPRLLTPPVSGTAVRRVQLPTCAAEWIHPVGRTRSKAAILYFHGSAFVALGLNSHRPFVSRLVNRSRVPALNVAYSLRPFAELEDAVQQGVDAYEHLVARGADPSRVVLAGDSAGGMLAAMVAIRLRDLGKPRPGGQILLSPVTDRDMEPKYAAARHVPDDLFPVATMRFLNDVYITRNGTVEPDPAPVEHDLSGLAPFLIQVGSTEILRPDAELLTSRLREQGVHAELEIWDRAPHVFQVASQLADARAATSSVVAAIERMTRADAGRARQVSRLRRLRRRGAAVVTLPRRG